MDIYYNYLLIISLLICGAYFFRKDRTYIKAHQLIFLILLVVTGLEMMGLYVKNRGGNNSAYYNVVFVYVESILLLFYFRMILNDKKTILFIRISIAAIVAWGLINSFFFQPIHLVFQNHSYALNSLIIIVSCILYFFKTFRYDLSQHQTLLQTPHFWIVTGILCFYSSSAIYFNSVRFFYDFDKELYYVIRDIIQIMSFSMYFLMAVSFHIPFFFPTKSAMQKQPQTP